MTTSSHSRRSHATLAPVVVEVRDVLVGGCAPHDAVPPPTRAPSRRAAPTVLAVVAVAVASAATGAALGGSSDQSAPPGSQVLLVDGTACEGDVDWHRTGDAEGGSGVTLACDDGTQLGARLSVRTSDGQQRWQVRLRPGAAAQEDRR